MANSQMPGNDHDPLQSLPPEERRKGVSPLIWILLLLALGALVWWCYSRSVQTGVDTSAPVTDPRPVITSEQEAAAQAERERAAANQARRAERERAQQERPAQAKPQDRDVEPIAQVRPEYPPNAARIQEEGVVMIRVQVDASGNLSEALVAKRSGSRDLDRAALEAVRKWRFRPAIKNGEPVAAAAHIPVEFSLDSP